jgi:hypothetical protein
MYSLKINVTKEIIERSAMCGFKGSIDNPQSEYSKDYGGNCAFALAFREIFPKAMVNTDYTFAFGIPTLEEQLSSVSSEEKCKIIEEKYGRIEHSDSMGDFISQFDDLSPLNRLSQLVPESFELEIPDYVIDKIDISTIQRVLQETPHLKLIESIATV